MSDPVQSLGAGPKVTYEKELLLEMNTPVHEHFFDVKGESRKIEFEVRIQTEIPNLMNKLNSYCDYDRYKAPDQSEDPEYSLADCLREF